MSRHGHPRCLLVLVLASGLTLAVVAFAVLWPFTPGIDDWQWWRVGEVAWDAALAPLMSLALIGLAALTGWRLGEGRPRLVGAAVVVPMAVLAFVAQMLSAEQAPGGYCEGLIALGKPGCNRYHAAARMVPRLSEVVDDYPRWMQLPTHKERITHPVGPLALFWGLNHVFAGREGAAEWFIAWCERRLAAGVSVRGPAAPPMAAALFRDMSDADLAGVWLASVLLPLAAALAVVPAYAFAVSLYGVRAGVAAAAFCAALPSFYVYSPGLDQLFPVFAVTAWWLSWTAGRRRSLGRAAVAGFVVSLGLFLSLSFAVVAGWAALLFLEALEWAEVRPRQVAALVGAAVVGFLVPIAVAWVAWGYESPAVWAQCLQANADFNAGSGRAYWKWVLANPVDFLVFLGVPVAVAFAWGVGRAVGTVRRGASAAKDWAVLSLAGLLVLLDLVGANRGEVSRLWMFLMPACVVVAAGAVASCGRRARVVFVWLFALQTIQVVVFRGCLDMLLGMYRSLGG